MNGRDEFRRPGYAVERSPSELNRSVSLTAGTTLPVDRLVNMGDAADNGRI